MKLQPTFANIYASKSPFWWNMFILVHTQRVFFSFSPTGDMCKNLLVPDNIL